MPATHIFELPEELQSQIIAHVADGLTLDRLLRRRHVSSMYRQTSVSTGLTTAEIFSEWLMDWNVFPRATLYEDIVRCEDKGTIIKYLRWHQRHEARGPIDAHNQWDINLQRARVAHVMGLLQTSAEAFIRFSQDKYTLETTLQTVYSLFADQIISQRLRSHEGKQRMGRRFQGTFLWWYHYEMTNNPPTPASLPVRVTAPELGCAVIACALGDQELVARGLESCERTDIDFSTCCDDQSQPRVKQIIDCPHVLGRPIEVAVRHGHTSIVMDLLAHGCHLKYPGLWSALKDAVLSHHHDLLQSLLNLERRRDYWIDRSSVFPETGNCVSDALALACRFNDRLAFNILLPHVDQPLTQEALQFIVFEACEGGAEEMARLLFSWFPALDANFAIIWTSRSFKVKYGTTPRYPIAEAAAHGRPGLVKLLLERGAKPSQTDTGTVHTAADNAARFGHMSCLQLLVDAGVQKEDLEGALSYTIDGAQPAVEKMLLDMGVEPTW